MPRSLIALSAYVPCPDRAILCRIDTGGDAKSWPLELSAAGAGLGTSRRVRGDRKSWPMELSAAAAELGKSSQVSGDEKSWTLELSAAEAGLGKSR